MKDQRIPGMRYFKFIDDELEIIRVISSSNGITKARLENGRKIVLPEEEMEQYTRLNPDAIVTFNVVKVQELEDVIVAVYRKEEIMNKNSVPYCICRQNINDFFSNNLVPERNFTGISISKDTTPEGVEYNKIMACDGIIHSQSVATYKDDTLESILSFVRRHSIYDNALYTLFLDHLKFIDKDDKEKLNKDKTISCVHGYVQTLKDLLSFNNFMYDFYYGFGVYNLDIDLTYLKDSVSLSEEHRVIISDLLARDIYYTLCTEYDYTVDLTKIQDSYILIMDRNNKLYVISYKYNDEYRVPIERVETGENIEKLQSLYPNINSVQSASKYIKLNFEKTV